MAQNKLTMLSIKELVADPEQPRQEFDQNEMIRLEKSIKRQGVLVPLAVEKRGGKYVIVDGERRFRASTKVGLKELPVIIYAEMDDKTRLVTRFHLQEQHSSWPPVDKARVLSQLVKDTGMTQSEVADLIGMSQGTVNGYLALLELNQKTVDIANKEKISQTYLRNIVGITRRIEKPSERHALNEALVNKVVSRVILRTSDVTKYGIALSKNQQLIYKAIIGDAELSPNGALELADARADMSLKTITSNAGWLKSALKKGMEAGAPKLMTEREQAVLFSLIETATKFVDSAGFILPVKEEAKRAKVVR